MTNLYANTPGASWQFASKPVPPWRGGTAPSQQVDAAALPTGAAFSKSAASAGAPLRCEFDCKAPGGSSGGSILTIAEIRRRLTEIYKVHKPENVDRMPYLLERYEDRENYLYNSVLKKYDINEKRFFDETAPWRNRKFISRELAQQTKGYTVPPPVVFNALPSTPPAPVGFKALPSTPPAPVGDSSDAETDDTEYDPFMEEPIHRIVQIDEWLLGEKSGFFDAALNKEEQRLGDKGGEAGLAVEPMDNPADDLAVLKTFALASGSDTEEEEAPPKQDEQTTPMSDDPYAALRSNMVEAESEEEEEDEQADVDPYASLQPIVSEEALEAKGAEASGPAVACGAAAPGTAVAAGAVEAPAVQVPAEIVAGVSVAPGVLAAAAAMDTESSEEESSSIEGEELAKAHQVVNTSTASSMPGALSRKEALGLQALQSLLAPQSSDQEDVESSEESSSSEDSEDDCSVSTKRARHHY